MRGPRPSRRGGARDCRPRPGAQGDLEHIAFPSPPETIDPHQLRSVLSGSIINLMGERLDDARPRDHGDQAAPRRVVAEPQPQHVGDQAAPGVKFSNGEDFTGESVKFTIERAITSKLNTLAKLTWPPSFGQG